MAFLLAGTAFLAAQQTKLTKAEKKAADVTIRVTVTVHGPKGTPVNGAGVVLRQDSLKYGRLSKHPFDVELHTDQNGMIQVQGFQPGIVLVQVIAKGFQTYGQAFIFSKADESVHIKLKAPRSQITIYR
ncbi:MAG: hypothetical protein ACRD2D_10835 [Terriglobales bacterium]